MVILQIRMSEDVEAKRFHVEVDRLLREDATERECMAVDSIHDILKASLEKNPARSAELDAAHDGEDALRSEVARLRAQVAALQCVGLTDDELDAIYPEGRSLGTYHHEIHRLLLRRVIAAGIKKRFSAQAQPTNNETRG